MYGQFLKWKLDTKVRATHLERLVDMRGQTAPIEATGGEDVSRKVGQFMVNRTKRVGLYNMVSMRDKMG